MNEFTLSRNGAILFAGSEFIRLVAAMMVYGVPNILTFNGDDFRRFPESPSDIK